MYGIIPAILTPLNHQREPDLELLKNLINFLIEKGVHGLYPCGTTGEGPLLTTEERKKVAETTVNEVGGSVKVMIHTGSLNPFEVIELSKHAEDIGADAVGVVTPFYYKYDSKAMTLFYSDVAKSVDLPVYLYNIPPLTGNWIFIDVIEKLVKEYSNVVGIKDTSGDITYILSILGSLGNDVDVLVGSESILLPGLLAGCVGGISGYANSFPELVVGVHDEFTKGNLKNAWEFQFKLNRAMKVVDSTNFIAYLKGVLMARGVNVGFNVKPPLREISDEEYSKIKEELKKIELS